jgi:hypothetical protein
MKDSDNRRLISIFVSASLVFLLCGLVIAGARLEEMLNSSEATVFVSPSSVNVRVNQTLQVAMSVSGVSDVYGWEFKLGYNNSLLELVTVNEGSFLNGSRDTYFVPKNMSADGYVLAGCTSLRNVAGVSGNGTLATVEFRAKKLGSCTLDLYDSKLVNSAKQLVSHSETDGTVTASGRVVIRVQYLDGYPRSGADVIITWPSNKPVGVTNESGLVERCNYLDPDSTYKVNAYWPGYPTPFGGSVPFDTNSSGDGSATIEAHYEITPPNITVLSPQNLTYYDSSVPLTFTVHDYSPISWIGYSLDNQFNTTITGNTIISVGDGAHGIVVYANDTFGNMGSSQMVCFTVNSSLYEPWETSIIGLDGYPMIGFTAYDGRLHATSNNNLYIYDGTSWNVLETPTYITSLMPYENKLIIGGKGGLYSYNGSSFSLIFPVSTYIKVLGVYNNTLYAGTFLDKPPTLYCCNGSAESPADWHVDTDFSAMSNFSGPFGSIDSFTVYDGNMYVTSGGTVFCYNGSNWSTAKTYDDVYAFLDMQVHNGKLYLATRDQAWRKPYYQGYSGFNGRVIEFDGNNWMTILDHDYWIFSLETYNGKLYVGTANRIYTYNGTDWIISFNAADGAYYAISFTIFNGKIYVGMGNGYIFADPVSEAITVPEFSSSFVLSLFSVLALLVAIIYRRKRPRISDTM